MSKIKEKELAIKLRKRGLSYSEILKQLPVAKSTLSLWLRSVGLAKKQKQRLTEKKLAAMKRGWDACRKKRILRTYGIKEKAKREINKLTRRDKFVIGCSLYWAEGAKEKEYGRGERVAFSNSDYKMTLLFMNWLKKFCLISLDDLNYELYIHDTANWKKAKKYWAKVLSVPSNIIRVYFKHNKKSPKRKNIGRNYYGLMRIRVKKSVDLNRKISGWIEGIYQNWGVV